MKLFFITLILLTTTLFGESKIIIAAFSTKEKTDKALNLYKTSLSYKKLLTLQKKDKFQVYTRTSGKYFVIVAEKFQKKDVAQEAHNVIKTIFPHSRLQNVNTSHSNKIKHTYIQKFYNIIIENSIYIIFTLIIFFTLLHYIIKFKRIYDQY